MPGSDGHVCQWQPPAGQIMTGVCEHCGHPVSLHIGVQQCVTCYTLAVASATEKAVKQLGQNLRRLADDVRDQPWPNT